MVAPLNIHAVMMKERIHDNVRSGAAVKDVSYKMQVVYSCPFDQFAYSHNHIGSLPDIDNCGDNVLVVILLVDFFTVCMQQFFYYIGIVCRDRFAHLGTGITRRDEPADFHEPVQRDAVPLVKVFNLRAQFFHFFFRIIDQCGKLIQFRPRHGVLIKKVQPFPHNAGAGIQNVQKCFIFSVHIRNKVFTSLWQVHDCLQVYNFRPCRSYGRILPRQHFQIAQFFRCIGSGRIHDGSFFAGEFLT